MLKAATRQTGSAPGIFSPSRQPERLDAPRTSSGHQAIGAALGGNIVRAKTQMHGKTDVITTDERGVYLGLPRQFTVIRYHSLVIEQASCPKELVVTSTSEDGEIMGVRHRELAGTANPLEGVQFHPESILSEHGHAMLRNFLQLGR